MAGGTKSYKTTADDKGELHWELVSYHPKFADRPAQAVVKLQRRDDSCRVAPHDRGLVEKLWAKSLAEQEQGVT